MSTTTTTTTATSTMRNPKDSMKSTWRTQDKKEWGPFHWIYTLLDIHPSYIDPDKQPPKHRKEDKVPHLPTWSLHRQSLSHALFPMVFHQLYVWYTGHHLSMVGAMVLYTIAFKLSGIHQLSTLRRVGQKWGFYDSDHPRDEVPDHSVAKVFISLINTSTFRSLMTIWLTYQPEQAPLDISWKMPALLFFEIGFYGIILDFWFYWYHRVMHESETLWKYHRTHHLTKHPNPLLTLYADYEQEFFDIVGIPMMTWFTMKFAGVALGYPDVMGFYDWWICHQYIMFTELSGHSGIRIHTFPPSPFGFILKYFDCELIIEDHDLHHRKGWKHSGNYGKQTRLWDRIFGTVLPRIECTKDNIDYDTVVTIPFI